MKKLLIIARQNLNAHLRKPSFYLATLGVPLMFGIIMLISNAAAGEKEGEIGAASIQDVIAEESIKPIGYVDYSGTITVVPPAFPQEFIRSYPDEAVGRAALSSGEIGTLYVLPQDYRDTGTVRLYISGTGLAASTGAAQLFRVLLLTNLLPDHDLTMALRLETPMQLKTVALGATGGEAVEADEVRVMVLPMGLALLFTIAIFMSSGLLLQAVVEEKENRTIEVIMASISPHQLLGGKVLGLGLLGLLQLVIWLALAWLILGASGYLFSALSAVNLTPAMLALALTYFLLGYLLFAALLAGVGAVSTTMRESSQLSIAVTLPASVPLFLVSPLAADPGSGLAVGLSLFPLTAPMSMLLRLATGAVPFWQVGLSLLLLLLAVVGALWIASRLFRASTLLTGKRLSLREIGRALAG